MFVREPQVVQQKKMQTAFSGGIATALSLAILFWLHRILTFTFLAEIALSGETPLNRLAEIFLVGAMSDWWVAAVGGALICIFLCSYGHLKPAGALSARFILSGFVGIWGLLLGIHQAYVEFFRHQIIPFHLSYLLDASFLAANSSSGFSLRTLATYGAALICAITLWRISNPSHFKSPPASRVFIFWRKWTAPLAVAVVMSGLVIHALNIRYRVQWFVPEQLQMNLVEKFFATLARTRPAAPLTSSDLTLLGYSDAEMPKSPMNRETLEKIVLQGRKTPQSPISPLEESLRNSVQERLSTGKSVLALTILMESFRPADIGIYSGHSPSLTPHFDELAASGILFRHAFSTGGVTRTGQEAVWCGFLGGQETSTMRGREDVRINCLPKMVRDKYRQSATAWIHGGDGGFDGQRNYWQRQNVQKVTSREDFGADAARTGWGVGDRTVFDYAARYFTDVKEPLTFSMLLSVSNHIPWSMPGDAPQDPSYTALISGLTGKHPSFSTTAYSDFALGELVEHLKKSNVWDHTILIIASDHGTLTDPYSQTENSSTDTAELLAAEKLSHIALLVTGGMVGTAVENSKDFSAAKDQSAAVVSQAGIAAFWANVFGLTGNFMAPSIFAPAAFPVFSDLGHALYLPANRRILPKESISKYDESASYSIEERRSILYYRAFIHLINLWGLEPQK